MNVKWKLKKEEKIQNTIIEILALDLQIFDSFKRRKLNKTDVGIF